MNGLVQSSFAVIWTSVGWSGAVSLREQLRVMREFMILSMDLMRRRTTIEESSVSFFEKLDLANDCNAFIALQQLSCERGRWGTWVARMKSSVASEVSFESSTNVSLSLSPLPRRHVLIVRVKLIGDFPHLVFSYFEFEIFCRPYCKNLARWLSGRKTIRSSRMSTSWGRPRWSNGWRTWKSPSPESWRTRSTLQQSSNARETTST